jgi:hypothetical protein
MLRRAVITTIKNNVPMLSERVYQAFVAPQNLARPYVTVKVGAIQGGAVDVEIRVYSTMASFMVLDEIEKKIISTLHNKEISDTEGGARYYLQWVSSPGDFVDDEKKQIGRLLVFEAAAVQGE